MDMSLPLDAREVLFHLNYMGYRHITKEQLKSFMTDLKKLIRYESQPNVATTSQQKSHQIPHSVNVERLFQSHTKVSLQKQRHKHPVEKPQPPQEKPQTDEVQNKPQTTEQNVQSKEEPKKKQKADKENHPAKPDNPHHHQQQPEDAPKSKMWIRPKSAQATRPTSVRKRTDPVALYQEYQKDWNRFKDNICESSRSDLRWQIREKMSRQH